MMNDEDKTKAQLVQELAALRRELAAQQHLSGQKLAASARRQAALINLSRRSRGDSSLSELMDEAAATVAQSLDLAHVQILDLAPDSDSLILRAGLGWQDDAVGNVTLEANTASHEAGYVLLSGEPLVVEDFSREKRFCSSPLLHRQEVVSGLVVVIQGRERPFGVLGAYSTTRRAFTEDELNFLEAVAHTLGAAKEQERFETEISRRQQELLALQSAAIENARLYDQAQQEIRRRVRAEEELRLSEANLRTIFDHGLQAFVLIDRSYQVQAFNKMAGEGLEPVLCKNLEKGVSVYEFVSDQNLEEFDQILQKAMLGDAGSIEKKRRINGSEPWFEFRFNPVFSDEGQVIGVCLIAINIDARKKMAESEARLLAEMQSILIIARALVSEIDVNNLLEFVMAQAKHLTNASGAAVLLLTDDGRWLELATPDEAWLKMKPGLRFLVQGSLAEMAIASQKVQVSNRAQDDERTASMRALLQTVDLHSMLCAPLTAQNKNLGVLMIWNRRDRSFSEADRRLMSLFADQAALAWHNAQLHAQNRQLAIVQERHRLARDLHDSVTQSLYSIGLAAQSTLWHLEQEGAGDRARDNLEHIHAVSESALNEIREQLYHLHPTVLNEDLVEALSEHCNLLRKQYGLDINLKARLELTLSEDQRQALYYVTREALWNIVKHANATQVNVSLTREDKHIILSIHDNGVGFDPQVSNGSGKMGLRNIEERVQLLGGRFNLHSSLEQGTQVTIYLPLQAF